MSDQKEKVFPKGVVVFNPHQNAPDWVIAEIIISVDELIKFVDENASLLVSSEKYGDQLKLTLKRSQEDKMYMEVNDYKPKEKQASAPRQTRAPKPTPASSKPAVAEEDSDLPF